MHMGTGSTCATLASGAVACSVSADRYTRVHQSQVATAPMAASLMHLRSPLPGSKQSMYVFLAHRSDATMACVLLCGSCHSVVMHIELSYACGDCRTGSAWDCDAANGSVPRLASIDYGKHVRGACRVAALHTTVRTHGGSQVTQYLWQEGLATPLSQQCPM